MTKQEFLRLAHRFPVAAALKSSDDIEAAERPREAIMGRPVTPAVLVSDGHGSEITPNKDAGNA